MSNSTTRAGRARRSLGTIRKRPSGRFQALYSGPDGTRRTLGTFASRTAAEKALAAVHADVYRGTYRAPEAGAELLADYARRWLERRRHGDQALRPSTLALYERLLDRWILTPLPAGGRRRIDLGGYPLRALSASLVADWHAALVAAAHASATAHARRAPTPTEAAQVREWATHTGREVAATGRLSPQLWEAWRSAGSPRLLATTTDPSTDPSTASTAGGNGAQGATQAAHAYALLRTICSDAVREQLLAANPCQVRRGGQVRTRRRRLPTPAQVERLAAHMPGRYRAAVIVAAWSALRSGELFALQRRHVEIIRDPDHPDPDNRVTGAALNVERALVDVAGQPIAFGPPKSEAGVRTVHLPPVAAQALAVHLDTHTGAGPRALVFATTNGLPVRGGHRTQMFSRAKARAGVDPAMHWHDLRHLGATRAAQAGATLAELQRRMGHSTVRAALVYQHATDDTDRRLAERLGQLEDPAAFGNVHHLGARR